MINEPIRKRSEAAAIGLSKYYTGRPCSKGHDALRYTASGTCVSCSGDYQSRFSVTRTQQARARTRGLQPHTFLVHDDDVPAVMDFTDALARARIMTV